MSFFPILETYKNTIDLSIQDYLAQHHSSGSLSEACCYALKGGKRFRPALVLMIANALGFQADVRSAALCIEFFHTASLIADDLPCMDNDLERRNMPSVHCAYGESTAILATYALISAGYDCLAKATNELRSSHHFHAAQADRLGIIALENICLNTGIKGITGGQELDLSPTSHNFSFYKEVLHKKTVSLFEISFVLGWIFGGGDLKQLPLIKKSALHFGMAFQLADDIEDADQDNLIDAKLNSVNLYGFDQSIKMFHEEINDFQSCLLDLNISNSNIYLLSENLLSHGLSVTSRMR